MSAADIKKTTEQKMTKSIESDRKSTRLNSSH